MDYDKYQQTPYTDPSVIKKLWREHFSRNPKQRNQEVTRAFEMKCSLYQFIHPDLSREEVRIRALDDIGVRSSSTASERHKKHFEKAPEISKIINEKEKERLENSSKKQNKHKKSKRVDVDECQVKNKIIKISNLKKLKPPKKTKVLEKVGIETSQIVCKKLDLNITNHKESHVKNVRISGKESSYSNKTQSTKVFTEISKIRSNDVLENSTIISKKITHTKRDKTINTKAAVIAKRDTRDKSLQEKNTCDQKYIKTMSVDENEVNVVKTTLKQKNTNVKGQENMSVINTTKNKVTQENSSNGS